MTHEEMAEILEGIAQDPEFYPRDRIQAIRALEELQRRREPEDPSADPEVLERLIRAKKK